MCCVEALTQLVNLFLHAHTGVYADILSVITACFLLCGIEREVESLFIEDGRLGVGHRKDRCHTASEGGLGDGVPIFFVGLSRFTHVDVRVNEAGEFDHRLSSKFQVGKGSFNGSRFRVRKEAGVKVVDMETGTQVDTHIRVYLCTCLLVFVLLALSDL